ncbi:N-acetylmuramoyl-L-alanine amidase [Rhodococcus pyridinivorans]|uniref:N-acetylmuramoyl-L-alanine amidase n=1 Tax=Rhodococcus pyridinivorans TaxID=103816 RepID=UPI002078BAFD|nr:N-acetylmuramoyl-L-alanine amidase [Rhodococcus pyridinivorans]USI90551.1 N-acetylmuramoyl-L-alanine amidase [Rhodococcus pyridinivorans]
MPHRRPKPSIVLGAVAALAVATPFAVTGLTSTAPEIRNANDTVEAVAPDIAEVVLASVPDLIIPLEELTGLNLPDLSLKEIVDGLPQITTAPDPNGGLVQRVGATVKELTRDTPFSLVALAAEDVAATDALIRAQQDDGSWGPWTATEPIETRADDATSEGRTGTEPIYVGATRAVQVLLTPRPGPEPNLAGAEAPSAPEAPAPTPEAPAPEAPAPEAPAPAAPAEAPVPADEAPAPVAAPAADAPDLGYVPASSSKPLRENPLQAAAEAVSAVLISPGSSEADARLEDIASPLGNSGLKVITRQQWGADESMRCQTPTYDDSLGGATVHHTAGSNNYSKAESAEIVRAIYAYHARTLGWCDIGYNTLVDKYGQIFEGRAGGLDRNVQGAHAGGFNENTHGIAMMGDFSTQAPPQAAVESVGKFLGWRLARAGLNPKGRTTMYSEGTSFTPYPQGAAVDLPIIFAHRDVGNTSCPGDAGYSQMGKIRDIAVAAAKGGGGGTAPQPSNPSPSNPQPSNPQPSNPSPSNPSPSNPSPNVPDINVGALASGSAGTAEGVVDELIRLSGHPLVQKWLAEGGELGRLGQAVTSILPAVKSGFERVNFVNGAIYTSPNGGTWTVLGEIYKAWEKNGLDAGELGLPTSDEYRVPDGWRSDFEFGSLIFNEVTGVVTKVLRAYDDAYDQAMQDQPADVAGPAPEGAPAPGPEPAPAPEPAPEPAPAG